MPKSSKTDAGRENGGPRFTVSLRWLLAIAFGGLVAISVAIVLALTVRADFTNTYSLLNTQAVELINGMERQIRNEADSAGRVAATVSRLYSSGEITMQDAPERRAVLETLLRTVPAVEGIFLFDKTGKLAGTLYRRPEGVVGKPPDAFLKADLRKLFDIDAVRDGDEAKWSEPVAIGNVAFENVAQPLQRHGQTEGVVVAVIGQHTINRIIARLGQESDATVFMLADKNLVIGHSRLPQLFQNHHAIPIATFPDEVLRKLPSALPNDEFAAAGKAGVHVFVSRDGRKGHVFMTKELSGYSAQPYTLGAYFRKADIGAEILRTMYSLLAGIAGLVAAVLAAISLGGHISRPMGQIARTASQFSNFEIEEIEPLPRSRVRELDDQAVALNKMRTTLKQFTRYVPRELVARLMRSGEDAAHPVGRDVTILFSDIVGFTSLSERMNPEETTALLNRHFAMITRHVEESGGTIDKFLGDGVMAFWGAPEDDGDHVLHAVTAASAIVRSLREENAERRARGRPALRLRIGIHTGQVVVGNIGGPDRQNYTIVGDPVNVAQRLEQMARDVMGPDDEAAVLVSSAVAAAVDGQASLTPAGTRIVRGRERPIAVSVLNVDATGAKANVVPFTGATPA